MAEHTNGTASANGTATLTHTRSGDKTASGTPPCNLKDAWAMRNATTQAMLLAEAHMQAEITSASIEDLIALVETFSPTRSSGPEWTRSFEPLAERLWLWLSDETMAALEADFTARGMPWMAVANAFSPARGAQLRERVRPTAWGRFPRFTTA
jgi:hypothetical protein